MADIFREIDDEVRREKAAVFWSRYGKLIMALAALAVLAVAGWQVWLVQERKKSEIEGAKLESALKLSREGNSGEAETILKQLVAEAPAGYRQIARFRLAAEQGKTDPAAGATAFDALAADASLAQSYRDLARLRAGMLRVDLLSYAELKTALEPLTVPGNSWRFTAREMLGIAALKANQFDEASRWFDALMSDPQTPAALRQRVELYLALARGGAVETKN